MEGDEMSAIFADIESIKPPLRVDLRRSSGIDVFVYVWRMEIREFLGRGLGEE
jgi:hypothetical protein